MRTKWKNLRDTFSKELKKMPVKRSGDEGTSWKSSWPYFQNLYFLKDKFIPRPSSGNLPEVERDSRGNTILFEDDTNSQITESITEYGDDTIDTVDTLPSPVVNVSSKKNK